MRHPIGPDSVYLHLVRCMLSAYSRERESERYRESHASMEDELLTNSWVCVSTPSPVQDDDAVQPEALDHQVDWQSSWHGPSLERRASEGIVQSACLASPCGARTPTLQADGAAATAPHSTPFRRSASTPQALRVTPPASVDREDRGPSKSLYTAEEPSGSPRQQEHLTGSTHKSPDIRLMTRCALWRPTSLLVTRLPCTILKESVR